MNRSSLNSSPIFKRAICLILVLEFLIPQSLLRAGDPPFNTDAELEAHLTEKAAEMVKLAQQIRDVQERGIFPRSSEIPKGYDRFWVTRQVHRTYRIDVAEDGTSRSVVDREIPLHNIDISNPAVGFASAKVDIKINYDSKAKELRFDRYAETIMEVGGKKIKNKILTDSHVILGVEVQGEVAKDANKIVIASTEGIHEVMWTEVAQKAFLAPFTVLPIAPAPMAGAKIVHVEFLNRGSVPRRLQPMGEGILDFEQQDGGIVIDIEYTSTIDPSRKWIESMLIPRNEIFTREKDEMLLQIAEILITNPDLSSIEIMLPYLIENQVRIQELIKKREALLGDTSKSLSVFATRNLSQRTDWEVLNTLFAMDNGKLNPQNAGKTLYDKVADDGTDVFDTNIGDSDTKSNWQIDWEAIQAELRKNEEKNATLAPKDRRSMSFREAYVRSQKGKFPENPKKGPGWTEQGIKWFKGAVGLPTETSDRPAAKAWDQEIGRISVNPDAAELAQEKELRDSTTANVSALRKKVGQMYDKVVTPGRVQVLGSLIAGVAVNHIFHGVPLQFLTSCFTSFIHWSTQVPGLGYLTKNIDSAMPYYGQHYAFLKTLVGMSAAMALFPLTKIALKKVADGSGKGWDMVTAYLNYGMQKMYAVLSYPFQRKLIWNPTRQDNVYPALQAKAGLGQIPVVNPFASKESHERAIQETAQQINNSLDKDAARKGRAMLIAAAVISRKTHTDIPSLLMAAQGEKIESFVNMIQDAPKYTRWTEVFEWAYRGLREISDDTIDQEIDKESLAQYLDVFEDVAAKFKEVENTPSIGTRLKNSMARLWRLSTGTMAGNVARYIFFGSQSLAVYEKFKNAELDPDSARIAMAKVAPDYYASLLLYAGQQPDLFGAMTELNPAGIRPVFDTFQQIGLGAATVGPDVLTTAKNGVLSNPNEPLSDDLFRGHFQREQTVMEALGAILEARLNPDTESIFTTHAKYLNNAVTSFQMRNLIGGMCRGMGLGLKAALAHNYSAILGAPVQGMGREAIMLLKKQAVGFDNGSITPGYTVLGAYVNRVLRDMSDRTQADTDRLNLGLALLETGIRLNAPERYQPGIEILIALRQDKHAELPPGFDAAPEGAKVAQMQELLTQLNELQKNLTEEELAAHPEKLDQVRALASQVKALEAGNLAKAKALLDFEILHPSVASKPNSAISNSWGLLYSFFSSAVMMVVNKVLWNPDLSMLEQLPKALLVFGATYATVKVLPKVTTPALRLGHQIAKPVVATAKRVWGKCSDLLAKFPQTYSRP